MKLKDRIAQFMYGRYGNDQFSKFLLIAALVFLLVSCVFTGVTKSVLWTVGLVVIVYTYVRMLSRDFYKRQRENAWYLQKKGAVVRWFRSLKDRWTQRREYRFFRCPSCHTLLRVPKGKGKILLTCRKCGTRFERKT